MTTRCLAVTGDRSIGKWGRLSAHYSIVILTYLLTYLLNQYRLKDWNWNRIPELNTKDTNTIRYIRDERPERDIALFYYPSCV